MASKKELLLRELAKPDSSAASSLAESLEELEEVSEGRFKLGRNEYLVLTDEDAESLGYLNGGLPTSDTELKVYRIR